MKKLRIFHDLIKGASTKFELTSCIELPAAKSFTQNYPFSQFEVKCTLSYIQVRPSSSGLASISERSKQNLTALLRHLWINETCFNCA